MDIRAIRDKYGYSRKDLAELLDVSPRTVESWEQGRYSPNYKNERDLRATLTKEEVDGLLGEEEEK